MILLHVSLVFVMDFVMTEAAGEKLTWATLVVVRAFHEAGSFVVIAAKLLL